MGMGATPSGTGHADEGVPARLAVLHTSVHTAHYPDQRADVWDAAAPAWVSCHHFDESNVRRLIVGLDEGRFHGLAFASAALQSVGNRRTVQSTAFAAAMERALGHGLGILVMQEFIGVDEQLRIPGLPAAIGGEIVDARGELTAATLATTGPLLGLDGPAWDRTLDILRRAESRSTGLSPTTERSVSPDGFRASTVFSGWRPMLPGLWRTILPHPTGGRDLLALGYSESTGDHLIFSGLPLDRWGALDLLQAMIARCVRPRGLLIVRRPGIELTDDADLAAARDAHVAAGGFVRIADLDGDRGRTCEHPEQRLFGDLMVVGMPLVLGDPEETASHRSRLEHGGTVIGRVEQHDGPVVRFAGVPEHLQIAHAVELDLLARLREPRLLLTFDFLALSRLARAVTQSVIDRALVPLGLRLDSLAEILGEPISRRIGPDGSVDGFVLPTAAAAASIAILRPPGAPDHTRMIAWAAASGAPEVEAGAQFAYLAHVAGRTMPAIPADRTPPSTTADIWRDLLRIRSDGVKDVAGLSGLIAEVQEPAILATVVLDVLEAPLAPQGPTERALRSALRPAIVRLRSALRSTLADGSGTVETVALTAAAVIRHSAAADLLAGTPAVRAPERRTDGRSATLPDHLALEQRKRFEAEIRGLREQRARFLPLVRLGVIGAVLLLIAGVSGVFLAARHFLGVGADWVVPVITSPVLVVLGRLWSRRQIGDLSLFLLLRRTRDIAAELDEDAASHRGGRRRRVRVARDGEADGDGPV
jgi:hypothetical protein